MGKKDIFEVIIVFEDDIRSEQFDSYQNMKKWANTYGIELTPMGIRWATIKGKKYQIKQFLGD